MPILTHTVPFKGWNNRDVALLLLGIFCSVFFAQGLMTLFAGRIQERFSADGGVLFSFIFSTLALYGSAALFICLFLLSQNTSLNKAFGLQMGAPLTHIIHGVLFGLAVFPISLMLMEGLQELLEYFGFATDPQQVITLLQQRDATLVITIGITSIIVAPIVEEVLFRGIIYVHLRDMGFPKFALWTSAIIFGMIHSNWIVFIPLTLFAVFLTLLYERYANILVCIAAHATFNAANVILSILFGDPTQ